MIPLLSWRRCRFPRGQGPPAEYSDSNVGYFLYCSYDGSGDLFADGDGYLTELSSGGQSLSDITLNQRVDPSSMQWIDSYQAFVLTDGSGGPRGPIDIYQMQISGSTGTVSGPIILKTNHDRSSRAYQFWTGDGWIIGPGLVRGNLAGLLNFWRYPRGGRPKKSIKQPDGAHDISGVTVSRASAASTGARSFANGAGLWETR